MPSDSSSMERLERVLDESPLQARERAASAFDIACGGRQDRLVLFGAGGFGRMVCRKLNELGVSPLAFADNNPALWGKEVEGTRVLSPKVAAEEFGQNSAFVMCIWNGEAHDRMQDRIGQLEALECEVVVTFVPLFWKYPHKFLPHYCVDLPEKVLLEQNAVRAAMELWSDEYSREEFVGQLEFRSGSDFGSIRRSVPGRHYFPGLFALGKDETFIDCGAFDGDTIADFVEETGGTFAAIHAFEPDSVTFPQLQRRIRSFDSPIQERIAIHREAVGRKPGVIAFETTGTMLSTSGAGTSKVTVAELDSALAGIAPTLIKFDVEGFEPDGLMGAVGTLAGSRPILAVSAYHLQNHLWRIPLLLASIVGENYQFYLRPHGAESWDLVCYAVPAERALPVAKSTVNRT